MTAIKTLIDQTWSWAHQSDDESSSAYLEDYYDFVNVTIALKAQNYSAAADLVDEMDTEPREAIICAIAEEYGADFVEKKLGWLV
jgi:hypothetical protein